MEEERLTFAVARVLDLPEEERVVSAPVRPDDSRDEMRERPFDERRLVDELEARLDLLVDEHAAGEAVREHRLPRLEDVHPETGALVQEVGHPRAAVDRDENERRPQGHRHERVRGHAVHGLRRARREHGHARGEHAERPAERDRRIAFEPFAELEGFCRRSRVERCAEGLGRGDRALDADLELLGDGPLHRDGL